MCFRFFTVFVTFRWVDLEKTTGLKACVRVKDRASYRSSADSLTASRKKGNDDKANSPFFLMVARPDYLDNELFFRGKIEIQLFFFNF